MIKFIFDSGNIVKHNYMFFQIEASTAIYNMCKLIVNSVPFQEKNPAFCQMVDEMFSLFQTNCNYNIDIQDFRFNIITNDIEVKFNDIMEALERRSGLSKYLYSEFECDSLNQDTVRKIQIFKNIRKIAEGFNHYDYTLSSFDGGIQFMNIKSKINKVINDESKLKAYATVTLDNQFVINGVKVIENKNGDIFVSMPQSKDSNGKYHDMCYPNNSDLRNAINESVVGEYTLALEMQNSENPNDVEEIDDTFEQSM